MEEFRHHTEEVEDEEVDDDTTASQHFSEVNDDTNESQLSSEVQDDLQGFKHFSHGHPLTIFLNEDVDDDDDDDDDIEANQKAYLCNICGLPILSSPSYTCKICSFFLHKPCAQLPESYNHPRHSHILRLQQSLDSNCVDLNFHYWSSNSDGDGKLWQNFTYKCLTCKFDVHPFLVVPVEIKSKHRSHKSHPLVAICRETSSLCDACGEVHKGFFFSCRVCDFWIHQDCAISPSILKLDSHPHFFILTYSLSDKSELLPHTCIICRTSLFLNVGLYFCCQCSCYAHVSCAKSEREYLYSEPRLELIQLPADKGDAFPNFVIHTYLKSNPVPNDKTLTTIEKYHKHPLILHDFGLISGRSREAFSLVCDVCIEPIYISSPFFQCLHCQFLAHNICANFPPDFNNILFSSARELVDITASLLPNPSEYFFNSVFPCFYCRRPCNGFCYCSDYGSVRAFFDLECIMAPKSIKHASHGQHVLLHTSRQWETIPLRCCSADALFCEVYRCVLCEDFCIHMRCALLPETTYHKFDKHPLELITSLWKGQDQYEYCFCEVCEENINPHYWYYGCDECEQYFHINCIPSVGYLSKVKFGGTLHDDNIHHHPVTLTRMLTVGRHETCGSCRKIIKGFVDEMAFHCSDCDFWIHFFCARNSSCPADKTSTKLSLYSEIGILEKY